MNDAVTGKVAVDEAGNSTLTDGTVQKNSTVDAFGSVASLTAYQWRHEMNDLTKRMGELRMSPDMREAVDVFTTFMYEGVYYNPIAKGEERKVQNILGSIWEYYVNHIDELPVVYQSIADDEGPQRAVCDYVSGMTDSYALEVYSELFIPAAWTIK
mgnify:CR=1 FL=1